MKKNVLNKKRKLKIGNQTSDSRLQTSVKGITLVALVITVIILLILAGVALSMITGGDGLFAKAKNATDKYNIESQKEEEYISQVLLEWDNYISASNTEKSKNVTISKEEYEELLKKSEKSHIIGEVEFTAANQDKTIDCTNIKNYETLTADDFFYKIDTITGGDNSGGSHEIYTIYLTYTNIFINYLDGILTINNGSVKAKSHQGYYPTTAYITKLTVGIIRNENV